MRTRTSALLIVGMLLLAAQVCLAAWEPVDLGKLGGAESYATGVNGAGIVVGYTFDAAGRQRAFMWNEDRGMVDLGTLGGEKAVANAINDEDEIVGASELKDGSRHAFLRTAEGNLVDLGALPGDNSSEAFSIATWAAGQSKAADGAGRAFVWTLDNGMKALSDKPSEALSINPSEKIVGSISGRAAVWEGTAAPLELHLPAWQTSTARGINKAGAVVGEAQTTAPQRSLAFYWNGNGDPMELPALSGSAGAGARAINDTGDAVGFAVMGSDRSDVAWRIPVIWHIGPPNTSIGRPNALPLLRGTVSGEAMAVSQSGLVAGVCRTADGKTKAVLWKQVPDRPKISIAFLGGVYYPTSSKVKDRFGSTWTRFALGTMETQQPTRIHFTAEGGAYHVSNDNQEAHIYTISAGGDKGFKKHGSVQAHVALRGGPYWGKLENKLAGTDEDKVGLNLNAAFGLIFSERLSLELRYDYFSSFAGLNFSGFSISGGLKLFDIRL